jgi:hypothetical protein
MEAYEFYFYSSDNRFNLIGILPERRHSPERITQKSIILWGKSILGDDLNTRDIYFIQVTINEDTGEIFRPTPYFITQQKVKK